MNKGGKILVSILAIIGVAYFGTILLYTGTLMWNYDDWVAKASPKLTSNLRNAKYLMFLEIILASIAGYWYYRYLTNYQSKQLNKFLIYFIIYKVIVFVVLYYNWQIFSTNSEEIKRLGLEKSMGILKTTANIFFFFSVLFKGLGVLFVCLAIYTIKNSHFKLF